MGPLERTTAFFQRHGTNAPRMAGWALARTLYRRDAIRRLVRPWVKPKRGKRWIFVVGCYNSGTTLLQHLLAAHPDVRTLPWEGTLITDVLPNPEEVGWTRMWIKCPDYMRMPAETTPATVDRLLRDWSPWWDGKGDVFLEKSITNTTRMLWLDEHLAPAHFVGIVRDGYCVAEGIRRKGRPRAAVAKRFGDVYPIEWPGEQWVAANARLCEDGQRVANFHLVKYEELMADPIVVLTRLWDYLQLPPPSMVQTADGLRVGENNVVLETGLNAVSWSRLSQDDLDRLRPVIGPWQKRLGYPETIPDRDFVKAALL